MVVVTTIGILALLGIPGIRIAAARTEATATGDVRMAYNGSGLIYLFNYKNS